MPILLLGVVSLVIFLVLGAMFFGAMEAEHHKREKIEEEKAKAATAR